MKKFIVCMLVIMYACDDITEVEDISNDTVTVLAPVDSSVLTTTNINFSWNTLEDAESYKLQIATPNFENANQIVLDTTITATNFLHALEFGSYNWRVRAENSDFQTNYTTQSFIIEE